MNKRSAMLVAAGLVLTLMAGGAAISAGLVGPAANAAPQHRVRHRHAPKPIIKTIRKTVIVHKKSPQTAAASGAIAYAPPVAPLPSWPVRTVTYTSHASSSGYHDDGGSQSGGSSDGGGGDD